MARKLFLESVLVSEDISQKTWTVVYSLIVLGALLTIIGVRGMFVWQGSLRWFAAIDITLGGLLITIGAYVIVTGLTNIKSSPPHVGLLRIWGERVEVLIREGISLLPKIWPFNVDALPVEVERKNLEFEFTDVRCRNAVDENGHAAVDPTVPTAGGAVTVKLALTVSPDIDAHDRRGRPCGARRVISYLNHGSMPGIKTILDETLGEATRHLAGLYDWESFLFMKAPLAVALLAKISDIDFKKLPRQPNGELQPGYADLDPEAYARLDEIELEPLEYLFGDDIKRIVDLVERKKEQHRRLAEIEIFLKIARLNGTSDIIDLGTHIARLNVSHIVPEGELAEDAEGAAREKKQRETEAYDTATGIMLARQYIDFADDGSLTKAEALQLARIDRKRATEQVIRVPDSPDSLTRSAAIVAGGR